MSAKRRTIVAAITFSLLSVSAAPAPARTLEMPLAVVSSITSERAESRVLLDLGRIPAEIRGELVTSAFLELPLPRIAVEQDVSINLHRVTTPWVGREPSWTSPWQIAGGDMDGVSAMTEVIWRDELRASLSFDVTEMIRDIADGVAEDCGFLLTVPSHRGEGFRAADLEALGDFTGAKLRVTYSPIKHLGFNGSRSIEERQQRLRAKAARSEAATEN